MLQTLPAFTSLSNDYNKFNDHFSVDDFAWLLLPHRVSCDTRVTLRTPEWLGHFGRWNFHHKRAVDLEGDTISPTCNSKWPK